MATHSCGVRNFLLVVELTCILGAGEVARWLRALAALEEAQGSFSITNRAACKHLQFLFQEYDPPRALHAHGTHMYR